MNKNEEYYRVDLKNFGEHGDEVSMYSNPSLKQMNHSFYSPVDHNFLTLRLQICRYTVIIYTEACIRSTAHG